MKALTKRVIRQIKGDKRTIAMIILAPMLILSLVYLLLGDIDYTPAIALDKSALPPMLVNALDEQGAVLVDIAIMPD